MTDQQTIKGLCEIGRRWFDYEPETGELFWRDPGAYAFRRNAGYERFLTHRFGNRAGRMNPHGYLMVVILDRPFLAHRIIWAMANGRDPVACIDHRDLCKTNNRLDNLREATRSQNMMNRGVLQNNTSGFKGVHWSKTSRRWIAKIRAKETGVVHLGSFVDKLDAADAYKRAAQEIHGEFAQGVTP